MKENDLIRKLKLIQKLVTSKTGKQIIIRVLVFLDPAAPQILLLQFQGKGWYERVEVLKFSAKMYLSSKVPHTLSTDEFFVSCL